MSMADDTEAKIAAEKAEKLANELESVTQFYVDNAHKVWHVYCLAHKGIIAVEAVVEGRHNDQHVDGALLIPIDDQLLSWRNRLDFTMGYTCRCGNRSILLDEEKPFSQLDITLPHIEAQIKEEIAKRPKTYVDPSQFKRVEVTNGL